MKNLGTILVSLSIIVGAAILGSSYTYKYKKQETVVVTGLGEKEFTSDLIVWRAWITADASDVMSGYRKIEESKHKVQEYIASRNIPDSCVVFMFVNADKNYEPTYSNGNYTGQRFSGYSLRQQFTVESTDVNAVENISREISSLIAQGVQIDASQPDYYYTGLDNLKLELIEKASADARLRAEKIASKSGGKLGKLVGARMGVFQITGANSNEEFSAGGSFNTSSRNKKARITMRLEYRIK